MAGWVVLAGGPAASAICDYLRQEGMGARPRVESDPWRLRALLRGELAGSGVVVGEGVAGPDPVNVAAALVADGCACDVVLAVRHVSGSLRSRAKRAGVARVLSGDELAVRADPAERGVKGASHPVAGARAAGSEPRRQAMPGGGSPGATAPVGGSSPPAASRGLVAPVTAAAPAPIPCATAEGDGRGASAAVPARRAETPVICFVSGRGGVGKTAICALASHIAAGWGLRVAALDLDLAFGNLFSLCGLERPADLTGIAREGSARALDAIDSCGRQAADGLKVWGPCAEPEHAELVQPLVEGIVSRLTHTSDLVLVDTTTSWGDAVACATQMADRLVIVSDERPGAVPALARCGSLAVRLGVARTRIVRLMNGCDARGRDEAFVSRAARGLECAREIRVLDGGDEAVGLLAAGHAADLARLDNPFSDSLATGLAQMLQELGRLPDAEGAARALGGRKRARRFLSRRREAS